MRLSSGPAKSRNVCFSAWFWSWLASTSAVFSASAWSRASEKIFAFCARPTTSRIRATLPSPMIVAPAKIFEAPQLFAQRFDDDFFRVIDLIYDQPKRMVVRLKHDDIRGLVLRRLGSRPAWRA